MRRLLASAAVLAATLAGVAAAAQPAAVKITEANPGAFPDRAYILTLPKQQKLVTKDVKVTENGQAVDGLTVVPAGNLPGTSATVLAIDASNSMRGLPIEDAMAAARAFAAKRPPNAKLGVVLFSGKVSTLLEPTTNGADIKAALANTPKLDEGTRIYDALVRSRDVLAATGANVRSVVLLSDGADVGSDTAAEDALNGLSADRARVFSVGLESAAYNGATLEAAAQETGGTYVTATTSSQLAGVFSDLGFKLGNEYLVLYRSFASPQTDIKVKIAVAGYSTGAPVAYTSPALAGVDGSFDKSTVDRIVQSPLSVVALVALMLALLAYAVSNVFALRGRSFRSRMASFVDLDDHDDAGIRRDEIRAALADADTSFQRSALVRDFADDCALAGIKASPLALVGISLAAGLFLGLIFAAIGNAPIFLLLTFVGPVVLRLIVSSRVERKRRAFADQLPDNLDVLAQSLRAGHSLPGALSVVAESAPEPSHEEMSRVVSDERLGVQLDDALGSCVTRMQSRDLDQVALVALLQRDAGGNAAEVIDQVAYNIRTRQELRRLARTLTAQGRMARWILTALPISVFVAIFLIDRTYLSPLWDTGVGLVGLILGIVMVIMGSFIIKKIVDIKV